MPHLQKINHYLERLIPVTTPLAIIAGFLLPDIFVIFRPFVLLLFGVMTFSGALKLRAAELGASVRSPVSILLFFIPAHILMPVIAKFASSLFFDNPDVISGFVLLFAAPTAITGFVWVSILKGDMALCLTIILLDTLLAPFIVPGSIHILLGAQAVIDSSGIMISLLFMIVIPTIIGVTANEVSKGKIPAVICPWFDPAAKVCLMFVIAANASIIAPKVNFFDSLVWQTGLLTIVLTVFSFLLAKTSTIIGNLCGKCLSPKDTTVIFAGGLRNNSSVMTIAVAFFPEAAVLPTLISIVAQQSIAAIMGKALIKRA